MAREKGKESASPSAAGDREKREREREGEKKSGVARTCASRENEEDVRHRLVSSPRIVAALSRLVRRVGDLVVPRHRFSARVPAAFRERVGPAPMRLHSSRADLRSGGGGGDSGAGSGGSSGAGRAASRGFRAPRARE